MSANATGTPSSLGIPTINKSQDPLTGDSVNEIVAVLNTLINGRMAAPSSPSDKHVVRWNSGTSAWVADYVDPANLKQSGATTGQYLSWSGTAWVPSTILQPITVVAKPSMSAATGGAGTSVMGGLAVYFTPTGTGKIRFYVNTGVTGRPGSCSLRYGTGTAPANGAATTGTDPGNGSVTHMGGSNAGVYLMGHATLTAGTQYWLDLVWSDDGAGTSQASNIVAHVIESVS